MAEAAAELRAQQKAGLDLALRCVAACAAIVERVVTFSSGIADIVDASPEASGRAGGDVRRP